LVRDAAGEDNMIRETWGWMHYAFYVGLLGPFIATMIIYFNDGIAEAAGFYGFPYYLVGMMEVL
jgi:hypothetical protein